MLKIDGSHGEGGGQILRTSLALSLVTGKPFRITRVRARRQKPGLMRQHLTAVRAAARIGQARVQGDAPGSTELTFEPGELASGEFEFSVGTAGSTTLVLQTLLPALMVGKARTSVTVEGGTHNPTSPPFDFLARAYLPLVNRMGPRVEAVLERPGFAPAGGGRVRITVDPAPQFARLDLLERGPILDRRVTAVVASLPHSIAEREVLAALGKLGWDRSTARAEAAPEARGPGNVVTIEIASEHVTELFTGFGQKGVPAERVAAGAADEALEYLEAGVPAGRHLGDQLMLPMALAGGGRYRTLRPSLHARTHAEIIELFLPVKVGMQQVSEKVWEIEVRG